MSVLIYLALIVATNVGFSALGPSLPVFLAVGLTMVARDFVSKRYGHKASIGLVVLGAGISGFLAAPAVAVASVAAFAVAELLDLAVFAATAKRIGTAGAVALSGVVGSVVDSVVFLSIAFGSLAFFGFQVEGKIIATLAASAVIFAGERVVARRTA